MERSRSEDAARAAEAERIAAVIREAKAKQPSGSSAEGSTAEVAATDGASGEAGALVATTPYAIKCFAMGDYALVYHWMGRVNAMAAELDTFPLLDWFWTEVTVSVPMTENGLRLARYMNDQEMLRAHKRNTSPTSPSRSTASSSSPSSSTTSRAKETPLPWSVTSTWP